MNSKATHDLNSVENYLELLLAFRALPETKHSRTFLEVSGFPHYENVCSNILRFYFDSSAEHGLKDLLLKAFLRLVGEGELAIPDKVLPDREYPAEDQQRIDLVINCENFTIGIENKINHWEANDFENYARVIDRLGLKKKTIKAVLCLNKDENQEPPKGGFRRFTYGELWKQVQAMLGDYISRADPKWVTCLLDFMETTNNLAGNNMENKKLDQFFIKNNDLLEQMVGEREAFLGRLRQKVESLKATITKSVEARGLSGDPWIWKKDCLVLDFKFKDLYAIHFNLYFWLARPSDSAPGWELQLFGHNAKDEDYLTKLLRQPALSARVSGERVWEKRFMVGRWPLDADLEEISEALRSWMRALIEADKGERS